MLRLSKLVLFLLLAVCSVFANPETAYFTYQIGDAAPDSQQWSLTTQSSNQLTGLTTTSGQRWIQSSLSSSSTPSILTISVNPAGFSVGTYYGNVEVYLPTVSNTIDIIVSLTVTQPVQLTSSLSSLTFNAVQGSAPPSAQSLQLGSKIPAGTAIFSETKPSPLPNWLRLNNSTFWVGVFNAPATLSFSIDHTNLPPGTYTATIKFFTILPDRQVTVPITLNVAAPAPTLKTNVSSLQFQYVTGSTPPTDQIIMVTSSGTPLWASLSFGATWLTTTALSGTTPFNTHIGVYPNGLAVGTYTSQVTIATNSFSGPVSSQTINVTLTIAAENRPVITSVVNAASFQPVISPGGWVSVMGKNFAPNIQQATSTWLSSSLNGVSVQLSGLGGAYSLLVHYVNPTQINAFVPHEIAPSLFGSGTMVTVTTPNGTTSYSVNCEAIAPALFSYGPNTYAAAIFPDGVIVGTTPGAKTPSSGSIISLYGTGFGQTNPVSLNINGPVAVRPLAVAPTVTVGGIPANVLWAGMVGMGLYQFNIEVPEMPGPGTYPVVVQNGGTQTVAVQLPIQ